MKEIKLVLEHQELFSLLQLLAVEKRNTGTKEYKAALDSIFEKAKQADQEWWQEEYEATMAEEDRHE